MLDLGSGGGIDVLLSARRVGPTGKAYGLDMTDEMLALARNNQAMTDVTNVEFLKGEIEDIPLPDGSVDVIISNCVINLSVDKPRVLAEAFRVLKLGGRFAVSDIVVRGPVDPRMCASVELWIGCVAGALEEEQYRGYLASAGFSQIEIEPIRIYDLADAQTLLSSLGEQAAEITQAAAGKFLSAFVRAEKPHSDATLHEQEHDAGDAVGNWLRKPDWTSSGCWCGPDTAVWLPASSRNACMSPPRPVPFISRNSSREVS